MELPMGYRFRPFDDELVKYYLLARVKGNPMPWNPIIECDLYSENTPGEMFDEASNQNIWYCFTRLKKKGKKVSRTAGGGTWHGETSQVKILDRDNNFNVIGVKKTFAFKMKNEAENYCRWNMHELSLVGEYEGCNLVLCVIKKKEVSETCLPEQEDGILTANTNNQGHYNGGLVMNYNIPPINHGGVLINDVAITPNNNNQPIADGGFLMNDGVITTNNNNQVVEALQYIDGFLMNDDGEAMQCNGGLLMNDNLPLITDGGIWMNDSHVVKASNNNQVEDAVQYDNDLRVEEAVQYNSGFFMNGNLQQITQGRTLMNDNLQSISHGGFLVNNNPRPNITQGEEVAMTNSLSTCRKNSGSFRCVY